MMIWYDSIELIDRPLFKENNMSNDYVSCESVMKRRNETTRQFPFNSLYGAF